MIARSFAGAGLLAHILTAKYSDHLPLYRQAQIYAREGVELDRSTMAEWVRGCTELIHPLSEALARYVLAAGKLHADDTPVPVLDPGPVKALSQVFRGKFLAFLKRAFDAGALALAGSTARLTTARERAALFAALHAQPWVVYASNPSPERSRCSTIWAACPELEGRYLRVVTLEDKVTIHNAFPDRGFKP